MKLLSILFGFLLNFFSNSAYDYESEINGNPKFLQSRQKALEWVFSKQNTNWGWGTKDYPETHRILTAIILSDANYKNEENPKYRKIFEQLKKELSFVISEKLNFISAGQLALYAIALKANDHDPRDFKGFNIVTTMMEKRKISNYEIGLVSLATCLAEEKPDFSINAELYFDILENLNSYFIDSRAMIIMALVCHREKYKMSDYDEYIQEQLKSFKKRQTSEGNFGNVYTSALVIQALIAAKDNGDDWSFKNSMNYLLSQQKQDGSFGDLLATYFVLPLLSGRNLLDVDNVKNRKINTWKRNLDYTDVSLQVSPYRKITVLYSVWSESFSNCFTFRSKKFTVTENSTFSEVMKVAQKEDGRYSFKASKSSFGSFVEEIDGIPNDKINHHYWMLYKIDETGNLILTSYGIDGEYPTDGDHYIFKYCTGICHLCERKNNL